jgi:hypothetical protein
MAVAEQVWRVARVAEVPECVPEGAEVPECVPEVPVVAEVSECVPEGADRVAWRADRRLAAVVALP